MVIFRYNSDVNFRYSSGGKRPLHQWWWISVTRILRTYRCSQMRHSLSLVMLWKILKTEENLRALERHNRRTQADYTNGWSTLYYAAHSWDAKLGKTQTADHRHDERSVRIPYWSTQRLSKRTVYRRQTFRSVFWRVWCLVNVEQSPHVVGTPGVVELGRKETWRELQKNKKIKDRIFSSTSSSHVGLPSRSQAQSHSLPHCP